MTPNTKTLRDELKLAFSMQNLEYIEPAQKNELIQTIQSKFVKNNPRAWWLSFLSKPVIRMFDENCGHLHLMELAPTTTEDVWLVIDEDNTEKMIFKTPLIKVSKILEECRYFEYYIVDIAMTWIIAENDHGDLLISRANAD